MKTLLTHIREIRDEKAGKVVPAYAIDRELRERSGLSQSEIDEQAAELEEAGLVHVGRCVNGYFYELTEE